MDGEKKPEKQNNESEEKEITLTVSYLMKTSEIKVKTSDNVGDIIVKFKKDRNIPESDNIRFVAVGKFLDTKLSFGKNSIDRDMSVRAFKSGNPSGKSASHQTESGQPQQRPATNQNMGQANYNMMDNPSMANNPNMMNNPNIMNNPSLANMMNNPSMANMMNNQNMMNPGMMGAVPPDMANMSPSQVNVHLDMVMNDPQMLDMAVRMMVPNGSEQEIEAFKKQFVENIKTMRENPAMMNMVTAQMRDMAQGQYNPGMGMPQMNPNMYNQMSSPNQVNRNMNPQMNNFNPMMGYGMNQNMSHFNNPLLIPCSHGFYHPAAFSLLSGFHNRNFGFANTQASTPRQTLTDQQIEEKYAQQLEQMYSMGYTNKQKNIKALRACNGNLELAINFILDNIGE
ncbi:Ubiquitin-like protein [Pseudoloma neurophilia]|uniref:Ubiquitin-like protein n=1 Tax=Pseudoloma neurophilia TaxID=146866 RepID=A0A0R0LT52_9MICR|nr:Ubiquitin-like protein [Pseudoloma neurophilia]